MKNLTAKQIVYLLLSFIAVIVLLTCSSCVTQKRCAKKFPAKIIETIKIKDSIIEKTITIFRDTTITLPGDSLSFHDTLFLEKDCPDLKDKLFFVQSQAKKSNALISLKKGVLSVEANCLEQEKTIRNLEFQLIDKSNIKYEYIDIVKEVPKEVIKKIVPRWCWWLLGINLLLIAYKIFQLYKQYIYFKKTIT